MCKKIENKTNIKLNIYVKMNGIIYIKVYYLSISEMGRIL